MNLFRVFSALLFIGLVMVSAVSAFYAVVLGDATIHAENGFLENSQVVFLAIALALFMVPAFFSGPSGAAGGGRNAPPRLIYAFMSLLCITFIIREIDFQNFDMPRIFITLLYGKWRNIILTALAAAIMIMAARNFSYYLKESVKFLKSKMALFIILGGVFLLLSEVFEKHVPIAHNQLYEETIELVGYFFIAVAALMGAFKYKFGGKSAELGS